MRYDSRSKRIFTSGLFALGILAICESIASAQVLRHHGRSFSSGTSYASGRSIFGSPFANQPFSISGMTGGSLSGTYPPTGGGSFGTGSPGNIGCGNGFPGAVAPGWWVPGPWFGFWGPPIGFLPPVWSVNGWATGFVASPWGFGPGWGFGPAWGFGPGWGWNQGFFPPVWNNGFMWDWGFLGAMENVVMLGNGRFGPARPVRQQRAPARNGIGVPPNPNGGGMNAVAPKGPVAGLPKANMPGFVRNAKPAQNFAPPKPDAMPPDRLQTADRLARNGLYEEALNRYRSLAEKHADDPAPWIRIAQVHALAGRPADSMKAFTEGESRAKENFSALLKTKNWSDIADSVATAKLRDSFEAWSKNAEYPGIEKLRASLSSSEVPTIAQLP